MSFTAQDVKNLREQTGSGMMDCKKALTDANGDFDKAVELLREKGLANAQKKAGRIASEGLVHAIADIEKNIGAMVEVNSETDFVAKNDSFKEFVQDVANIVKDNAPADVETLLTLPMSDKTVAEVLTDRISVIGENLKIRRFVRYEGPCIAYIHGGGTHGVLVQFETSSDVANNIGFVPFGKDIAMQIAAANPLYVNKEDVPESVIEEEKKILTAQAINEGKPEEIAKKMVVGRIEKYYKEFCLMEQPFVKDDKSTVAGYIEKTGKELGGEIKVVAFSRFEKGEGIEKREDDFAAEVAKMVK
jgi:translation elongation factor Ts